MRVSRSRSLATFVGVLITIHGCDDATAPPAPGAISVVVRPSGEDVIADGLHIKVGNAPAQFLVPGQLNVVIVGVQPGNHAVRLEGLAGNCQVSGANPRVVTVTSDQTTIAAFDVVCSRRTGSVRITTATIGTDLDPDGYTALVDGGSAQPIGVNGTITIADVREGQHMAELRGVSLNCIVAGAATVPVNVQFAATSNVTFTIQCAAAGILAVTVATTGTDVDPDGYTVNAYSESASLSAVLTVAPNAGVTFPPLRPATDYHVTLGGIAANCRVSGVTTQMVAVTAGSTTRVEFDVSCEPPALLAFERDGDIYVIKSNGIGAVRLTTEPGWDADPAWSTTGRIAFSSARDEHAQVYVMNEDGTGQVRVTTSDAANYAPSWSPNGEKIVFQSDRDGNSEIYVANADGSGLTRLTTNDAIDNHPAWSSTGKIAFVSTRDHASGEIYVMNVDGSNVVRLTQNDLAESSPAWSPDGSMIAFARETQCYYYACTHGMYVMNADGSHERTLVTSAYNEYQGHPSWSPDGRLIAFTNQYCPYYCEPPSVLVVDLQGSPPAMVTGNGAKPAWKP
jgi:hypothetical protein